MDEELKAKAADLAEIIRGIRVDNEAGIPIVRREHIEGYAARLAKEGVEPTASAVRDIIKRHAVAHPTLCYANKSEAHAGLKAAHAEELKRALPSTFTPERMTPEEMLNFANTNELPKRGTPTPPERLGLTPEQRLALANDNEAKKKK